MAKDNRFVIAVYVDNKFGVLTRVTSMFTRRGFNIDALTVGETECPEYSRITISLSGDGYATMTSSDAGIFSLFKSFAFSTSSSTSFKPSEISSSTF